jgi:hypothetical protein
MPLTQDLLGRALVETFAILGCTAFFNVTGIILLCIGLAVQNIPATVCGAVFLAVGLGGCVTVAVLSRPTTSQIAHIGTTNESRSSEFVGVEGMS